MRRLTVAILFALGCVPSEGPLMRPGEDCMRCHASGKHEEAPSWTIAGTIYGAQDAAVEAGLEGALVHIIDAKGATTTMRTNQAGNFYSADAVAFPVQVAFVERNGVTTYMQRPIDTGACNSCHTLPPDNGAPGRIAAP
jgi:hypothetical protein